MISRTDLAMESAAPHLNHLPKGAVLEEETRYGLHISHLKIRSKEASEQLGRPMGQYYTLETAGLGEGTQDGEAVADAVEEILTKLLPADGCVLVVGLGNRAMTPDALGPKAADKVLATRHLSREMMKTFGLENPLRQVCTIQPGVLASTGVESAAVVEGIVKEVQPSCIVAVDAMAASGWERLGAVIQISDTGIAPGAGVHNARKELSLQSMGMPVIAIGIPTVVDGGALAQEILGEKEVSLPGQVCRLSVTPRNIDALIERGAYCISLGLNKALHPELSAEDILFLLS